MSSTAGEYSDQAASKAALNDPVTLAFDVSMTWLALSTVSDKDTFSFIVPPVVRLSSENGDPGQAGPRRGRSSTFPA